MGRKLESEVTVLVSFLFFVIRLTGEGHWCRAEASRKIFTEADLAAPDGLYEGKLLSAVNLTHPSR